MSPLPSKNDYLLNRAIFPFLEFFLQNYCRLESQGLENLPRGGNLIFVANHGGWFPLDGFVVGYAVNKHLGLPPISHMIVADVLLRLPVFGALLKRAGCLPVSQMRRLERLKGDNMIFGLFPEGKEGNSKPFTEAYRLRDFKIGFVLLALALRAKVVPVSILGGDECFPVLKTVRCLKPFIGTVAPLPLSLIPLPVRWRLSFHKPVDFGGYPMDRRGDDAFCEEMAQRLRGIVQEGLDQAIRMRGQQGRLYGAVARLLQRNGNLATVSPKRGAGFPLRHG